MKRSQHKNKPNKAVSVEDLKLYLLQWRIATNLKRNLKMFKRKNLKEKKKEKKIGILEFL